MVAIFVCRWIAIEERGETPMTISLDGDELSEGRPISMTLDESSGQILDGTG